MCYGNQADLGFFKFWKIFFFFFFFKFWVSKLQGCAYLYEWQPGKAHSSRSLLPNSSAGVLMPNCSAEWTLGTREVNSKPVVGNSWVCSILRVSKSKVIGESSPYLKHRLCQDKKHLLVTPRGKPPSERRERRIVNCIVPSSWRESNTHNCSLQDHLTPVRKGGHRVATG